RARGDRLSLVFQDPATRLNPLQRVESHFVELIRAHRPRTPKAEAARMAREALAAVGVPPARAGQYPHEFSGGMRQRIMIALAVVLEPRVLVADEPTTSLDVLVEAQILDLLTGLRRRLGLAVVLITHNLGIVAETCDRVAVMYAGRIVEQGPVSAVFAGRRLRLPEPPRAGTLRCAVRARRWFGSAIWPCTFPSGGGWRPRSRAWGRWTGSASRSRPGRRWGWSERAGAARRRWGGRCSG